MLSRSGIKNRDSHERSLSAIFKRKARTSKRSSGPKACSRTPKRTRILVQEPTQPNATMPIEDDEESMENFIVDDENESSAESCYRDERSPSPSEVSIENLQTDRIIPESESDSELPLAQRRRTRSSRASTYTHFFPSHASAMPESPTGHFPDESEGFEVLIHESRKHLHASVADENEDREEVKPESHFHSPRPVSRIPSQRQQMQLSLAPGETQHFFEEPRAPRSVRQGTADSQIKPTQRLFDSPSFTARLTGGHPMLAHKRKRTKPPILYSFGNSPTSPTETRNQGYYPDLLDRCRPTSLPPVRNPAGPQHPNAKTHTPPAPLSSVSDPARILAAAAAASHPPTPRLPTLEITPSKVVTLALSSFPTTTTSSSSTQEPSQLPRLKRHISSLEEEKAALHQTLLDKEQVILTLQKSNLQQTQELVDKQQELVHKEMEIVRLSWELAEERRGKT